MTFVMLQRSIEADDLQERYPNAFLLLSLMSRRAKRYDDPITGLKAGECFLGDHKKAGLTQREYRTAKKQLEKCKQATFKATNKGTIGKIIKTTIYDINGEDIDKQYVSQETSKRQASDKQATTNKEYNNIRKEKKHIPHSENAESEQNDQPTFYLTKRKRKLTGKRLETFDRFWDAFNYKKDRASAADSWLDIPQLTESLVNAICDAAKKESERRPDLIANGRTPKMAQGWITARRWEDEDYKPTAKHPLNQKTIEEILK